MLPVLIDFGAFKLHSWGLLAFLGRVTGCLLFLVLVDRDIAAAERRYPFSKLVGYSAFFAVLSNLAGLYYWTRWRQERRDQVLLYLWSVPAAMFVGTVVGRVAWAVSSGHYGELVQPWNGGEIVPVTIVAGVALLGALAARRVIRFWYALDRVVPSIAAACALTKVGCFLAGCCYGSVCNGFLCVRFPPGSLVAEAQVAAGTIGPHDPTGPLHPAQLYHAALAAAVAIAGALRIVRGVRFEGEVATLAGAALVAAEVAALMLRGDKPPLLVEGTSFSNLALVLGVLVPVCLHLVRRRAV